MEATGDRVGLESFAKAYGVSFAEWLRSLRAAARVSGWATKYSAPEAQEDSGVVVDSTDEGDSLRVCVGGESFVVSGMQLTADVWDALRGVGGGFNVTATQTGRLSSKLPRMQNAPRKLDGITAARAEQLRDAILATYPKLATTIGVTATPDRSEPLQPVQHVHDELYLEPPMYDCEECMDTGAVLSGEDGPLWKQYDPCSHCDAEFNP